jgi:alpha-L-fucosidase 2
VPLDNFLSKEENDAWWKNFWNKSYIDIEDKNAERMWYFGLFLLGSCSKSGKQAPSIQGLWQNEYEPAWHAEYAADANIQMTYWPIYTSNHLEIGRPFYELYNRILPKVKEDTKFYFGIA